jgi:hypothetical protein
MRVGAMEPPPNNARISFWGQSNAAGAALRSGVADITADTELVDWDDGTLTFDRVMFWNGTAYATYVPGSNHGTDSTLLGPEFGFAVRWMRETTTGVLYMSKNAFGGTSIELFAPPSAARWLDGVDSHTAQNAWLATNGVSIDDEKTFWFWSQGEAEYTQPQSWYQPRLQDLADACVVEGILPYRGVITLIPDGHSRYGPGMNDAKQAVADGSGGLLEAIMQQLYMEPDNLHFNARGMVQTAFDTYAFCLDAATITV